jgi:adenine-specific DNA-methyltransferase
MAQSGNELCRHGDVLSSRPAPVGLIGDNPEAEYLASVDSDHRKALGQFFTPPDIAGIMADWISGCRPSTILDPAVGAGVLLLEAHRRNPRARLVGIEIDENPARYARERLQPSDRFEIRVEDFLRSKDVESFDAITCNPPYVRHHRLKYEEDVYRAASAVMPRVSRMANLYVLFVAAIWKRLNPGGRASILIPADWLNANYGVALKKFLIESESVRRILYFTNDFDLFADALTTAVLLMLEKTPCTSDTEVVAVSHASRDDLVSLGKEIVPRFPGSSALQIDLRDLDVNDKWDRALRGTRLNRPNTWIPLKALGKTKRGIATGANKYFHLSNSDLLTHSLSKERTRPCVGKSSDVVGLIFGEDDVNKLSTTTRFFLLDLDDSVREDRAYLQEGLRQGLSDRYLTANRKRWWHQEQRDPAPCWVGVFGRDGIKFVRNRTTTMNLTCFHCLYVSDLDEAQLDAMCALLNSSHVQRINESSERAYGGGLRKVEPRDLLQMSLPDVRLLSRDALSYLGEALIAADQLLRTRDSEWRTSLDEAVSSLGLM